MANKLKDMEISSSDLCRRGANPLADIKLFKSDPAGEGGENMDETTLIGKIRKLLSGEDGGGEPITKAVGAEQVAETTDTLRKSWESILADDSLTAVQKHDMMAESLQAFTLETTDLMDGWAGAVGKAEEPDDPEDPEDDEPEDDPKNNEPGGKPEHMEKGVFDMANIDVTKMSPEDKATLEALEKKYNPESSPAPAAEPHEIHPEVQKAMDEMAELRKSLELKELEGIAKKYEVIGKKAEELAPKLYELKKAGDTVYNDYVALLDEQVQMQQASGIFKEVGTSRSGGAGNGLEATVAEIRKAEPTLTREEAVIKAFETNPNIDPFTGEVR